MKNICIDRQTDRQTDRYPPQQEAEESLYNYRQQTGHCIFDSDIGNNVDLDISLAHSWSSDIFPSSAGVSGVVAERRADRKKKKYSKQQFQVA